MSCVREEGYGLGREAISCMRQNMKGKALGHLLPACLLVHVCPCMFAYPRLLARVG
jgi:hypothetical protein